MIYVRWAAGEPRRGRVFEPLTLQHPEVQSPCVECGQELGTVDRVQLVAVGPTDTDDQMTHDRGGWYSAGAVLLHETCAERVTDDDLEALVSELRIATQGETRTPPAF